MVGMSSATPKPPKITNALRAFPTDQPRLIKRPESQPLKKFPRSAAMKGIQTAIKPLLRAIPLATR